MAKKRTRQAKIKAAQRQIGIELQVETPVPVTESNQKLRWSAAPNQTAITASQARQSADAQAEFANVLGYEPSLLKRDFVRTGLVLLIMVVLLAGVSWWLR